VKEKNRVEEDGWNEVGCSKSRMHCSGRGRSVEFDGGRREDMAEASSTKKFGSNNSRCYFIIWPLEVETTPVSCKVADTKYAQCW